MKSKRQSQQTKTSKSGSDGKAAATGNSSASHRPFFVAGIGASAGGIEAFSELMRSLPLDTGMAFVLVQHLDPKHESALTELLARETRMAVTEVKDGMRIEPNRVYVIPPNKMMSVSDNHLRLSPREEGRSGHMPIDYFLRSLAEQKGNCAIGVILSGTGSDGTLGCTEIQAQGGVTFAQSESSARYSSMPRSAIATGCVDYILTPKAIGYEMARIARHPHAAKRGDEPAEPVPSESAGLSAIFQLMRRTSGIDFRNYRQTTILRRIQRRMLVHNIDNVDAYAKYLQTNPAEIDALYQDMLINVTSFFRNPAVFDAMKATVFPSILKNRKTEESIRIWTPACASGEETYSVAIALLESLGGRAQQTPIQLFGTDVSETTIVKARTGLYPDNIQGDVSPERLRRFFTKAEGGYRISKTIRDMCIFARHNVLDDPPFSQMDLICCRNLLIYLEPVLQSKVISLFHYATRRNGFLILGTSEGVGAAGNLFAVEDRAHKIFSRKAFATRQVMSFSLNHPLEATGRGPIPMPSKPAERASNHLEAQREFDRLLLTHYAPATAFVNGDLEVLHTRGDVSRYLKLAPGRASLNILKMAREGLSFDLRNSINRVKKGDPAVSKRNVRMKDMNGKGAGAAHLVDLEVAPCRLEEANEPYYKISFRDSPLETGRTSQAVRSAKAERESQHHAGQISKLEQELAETKEYLQALIETQEATNEELQSANEEILSSNEELQSTNEELETAKEELQSANEELTTVNDELRSRNTGITQVNSDLVNLLASIEIAVVMVAGDLTIRRFTPQAEKLFGLIPADVGRPFPNINPTIDIPDLQQMVAEVVSTVRSMEKEFRDEAGKRRQIRIHPYRTLDGKPDGAVITLYELSP